MRLVSDSAVRSITPERAISAVVLPTKPPGVYVFVITMLLRRRPDLSAEEFHDYWREHHGPLAVSLSEELGIRGYVQLHTIPSGVGEALAKLRDCSPPEWDGIALVSFDSEEAAVAAGMTPEGRAASSALLEDERNFLDLPRCELFITESHTLIDSARP